MDALTLSRIQFGLSVGFHYLFPVTTLGLTLFILIYETLYLRTSHPLYKSISGFFVRLLGPVFALGVATGLLLPFAFGANWARFSAFAGPVFGAALTVEAVTAFALESAFLAILVFGRKKASRGLYWASALIVFLGAHLSAFWIVSANSWMQTPAGFALVNGRTELTGLWRAVFNPSFPIRFLHVLTAAWLTGAFLAAGLAAGYAARGLHREFSAALLRAALPMAFVLALAQPVLGHLHILQVLRDNPEKDAAYEGIFHTVRGATLYAFGVPDARNERILFGIGVPYALSFLETGDPLSEVRGLAEYPRENWPPVNVIFTTFHLMVGLGVLMLLFSGAGALLLRTGRLFRSPRFLRVLPWLVPLPYLANELGWIGAEIGRQPWIVYGVLRTADAHSAHLPAWQVALTLSALLSSFALISVMTARLVRALVASGPREEGGP